MRLAVGDRRAHGPEDKASRASGARRRPESDAAAAAAAAADVVAAVVGGRVVVDRGHDRRTRPGCPMATAEISQRLCRRWWRQWRRRRRWRWRSRRSVVDGQRDRRRRRQLRQTVAVAVVPCRGDRVLPFGQRVSRLRGRLDLQLSDFHFYGVFSKRFLSKNTLFETTTMTTMAREAWNSGVERKRRQKTSGDTA